MSVEEIKEAYSSEGVTATQDSGDVVICIDYYVRSCINKFWGVVCLA